MAVDDFAQSSAQVALYKECVAKAANDGRVLMDGLVDKCRQALPQKAQSVLDPAERHQLGEAARHLNVHAAMLIEKFPITLMAAFSEAAASDFKSAVTADKPAAKLKFDELELMDESQVQESIELARAQQMAAASAELALAELNGLICAVLGLKTVQPDRNPLRPEVYVKALNTALKLTGVDNTIRIHWLQFMGVALGERLKDTYPELSRLLLERGVRPVGYVVTQTAQAGSPQGAAGAAAGRGAGGRRGGAPGGFPVGGGRGGPGGTGGGSGGFGSGSGGGSGSDAPGRRQTLLTVDQLRRLLAGELDSARQNLQSAAGALGSAGGGRGGPGGAGPGGSGSGGPGGLGGRGGGVGSAGSVAGGGRGGWGPGGAAGAGGAAGGGAGAADDFPPHQDFDHTVPAAFEALQEMRQVERVIKRLSDRQTGMGTTGLGTTGLGGVSGLGGPAGSTGAAGAAGADSTPELDRLRKDAHGVGQALGLEVVNLMFENIAQDPHLLPPVQAVIRRVESAYLRLALIDPRFFSDRQHVARRLLEQMTERSLAYATIVAPGFDAFLQSLRSAADVLAVSRITDLEPFARALSTLEADWARQAQREGRQRDKAVHTLLHAEQRNLLAERLANDVRERPGANMAPTEVINFLSGPWAQVLAEARLRDRKGAPDPGGYLAIVNDLIWTTQPEQTRVNLDRIKGMIPALLERLREGLELIEYPAAQIDAFSVLLMALYDNMQQPGMSTLNTRAVQAQAQTGADTVGDTRDPWLRQTEMADTGFFDVPEEGEDKRGFKHTETLFESTAPLLPESEEDKRAAERAKPPIPPGAWVELRLHDQTMRAQLTWSSPYGTLFMFTDAAGTTHSLTRRALDKLLARGSVTVISQGVVDDALDAVAQKALSNSVDVSL